MEAQLAFLHFLEGLRSPVFDAFFSLITHLGSETALILLALLFYWCFDKKNAYYLFLVGFVGTVCNQFLKLAFRIERPWVLDPSLSPVENAIGDATGYSFPSGHTQSSVGLFGVLARLAKKPALRWAAIAVCILVPFSRMYLGVHTPMDVLVSAVIALALVFGVPLLLDRAWGNRRRMLCLLGGATALSALFLLFVLLFPFPAEVLASHNYESGLKNAYTLLGALLGLIAIYLADEYWLHFDTRAPFWGQAVKVALGAAIAFGIKAGLKAPLTALFGVGLESLFRYFLLVVFAGALWPLTFRFFARIGAKKEETGEKE